MRSLSFSDRPHGRYWWFHQNAYVPPIFALLSDEEWQIVEAWYEATDSRGSAGEANIACLSALAGFVEGNGIPNIVQLGHFEGFSALLLGFMMRRMGRRQAVFSVDIHPGVSEFTREWIERAGLGEQVKIVVASSDEPSLPARAREYFETDIAAIFIDSSHQYRHTLRELDLWWPALRSLGLVFLHDASDYAASFDSTGEGGVRRALREWTASYGTPHLLINEAIAAGPQPTPPVYLDGCGLAILHKL